jgi:hypothetical protein
MENVARAKFIRWVAGSETFEDLLNDAKALIWETEREHAVIVVRPNRRALVRGGRLGIEFLLRESNAAQHVGLALTEKSLWVDVEGIEARVEQIEFHTHPLPTGPSDHDLRVLEILRQKESRIVEIGGERLGTVIRTRL